METEILGRPLGIVDVFARPLVECIVVRKSRAHNLAYVYDSVEGILRVDVDESPYVEYGVDVTLHALAF